MILSNLESSLQEIVKRDPEQEVRGIAIPAIDAVISTIRNLIPNSPIVSGISDVISPETLAEGEPIRAVDALIVVTILLGAIPPPAPKARARFTGPD